MTKFQKQMLTIAAAGALTAVTALPAMAFENEFHGTMTVKTFLSNFENGGVGIFPTRDKSNTNNYTDQRTRIQYIAKASDDLKLVTHFEMNTNWGAQKDTTSKLDLNGGDIDTDGYSLVVKHAYLDFNIGKALNVKAGQQAYKDTFKGLYVDADLPMVYASYKRGAYTLGMGYSRFNDEADLNTAGSYRGDLSADLYAIDNTFALGKDTKVGFSYYLNRDDASATIAKRVNTLGVFGQTKLGALDLSGFAAMQAGYLHNGATKSHYHGMAANVLAKMKLGNGLARTGFLFTSGDNDRSSGNNHAWQTLSSDNTSAVQNSYNESGMMLLVRNTSLGGTTTDGYLRKPITNIALLHMGYDATITEKLYANGNVGFAWLPSSANVQTNSASTVTSWSNAAYAGNGSDFMAAELNVEVGYKLYQNLTLKAQGAYVMLGGAFSDGVNGGTDDPANPWTMRLAASYAF